MVVKQSAVTSLVGILDLLEITDAIASFRDETGSIIYPMSNQEK